MRWLAGACLVLGACHLAETIDPEKCPRGTHAANGQCAPDLASGEVITIASCVLTPDSVKVAVNGDFSFKNDDDVDHTITGDDGKVWVTAPAKLPSPVVNITRVGTWAFTVSGCSTGGTVVVE